MVGTRRQIDGDVSEESLDLVDPIGVGGRVVHVEAGMATKPGLDRRCLMHGVVVAYDVHLQVLGDRLVDLGQGACEPEARRQVEVP